MDQDLSPSPYARAGVDEQHEQDVFSRAMRPWLARTKVKSPMVTGITGLASGYFATLMQLPPGPAIALTTDGVGTKILLAREAARWEPVGIDCVANNVNDLICVGAVPLALLDYMATDRIDESVLKQSLTACTWAPNRPGSPSPAARSPRSGHAGHASGGRPMLDLVGTAIGALPLGRVPVDGSQVRPGTSSWRCPARACTATGTHWPARRCSRRAADPGQRGAGHGQPLDDALLAPTRVYVRAPKRCGPRACEPRGLVNISGGGLLNLARLAADVSYALDELPSPPPVFSLIAEAGRVPAATMYATFNMGIGFGIVVPPADEQATIDALRGAGEQPVRIGIVTDHPGRSVTIPSVGLTGHGEVFTAVG